MAEQLLRDPGMGSSINEQAHRSVPHVVEAHRWEASYDGTIQAQSGGISVTNPGAGTYLVTFGKDVTRCAIVVTSGIAGENGIPAAGVNAEVASNSNTNPNLTPAVIRVISTNFDGTPQSYSFSLVALC